MTSIVALALAATVFMKDAGAQDSRYSNSWRDPAAPERGQVQPDTNAKMDQILGELGELIDAAERARAADPRLISDLRDLARRYAWPWRKRVAFDDFADGNLTSGPAWQIIRGDFRVSGDRGLQTTYVPVAPRPAHRRQQQPQDDKDVGKALLKGLLQQMVKRDRSAPDQPAPTPTGPSEIGLAAPIPNAFAVRLVLETVKAADGRLEFGVAQGNRALGYRLAYNTGASPALELLRVGGRGSAVIDSAALKTRLDDAEPHVVLLTRDSTGELAVSVDGAEVLRVIDRGFRDAFDSFVLVNRGGEYMVRSVAIYGG
jgi:hypothetical protein